MKHSSPGLEMKALEVRREPRESHSEPTFVPVESATSDLSYGKAENV